jgi:membrane protein
MVERLRAMVEGTVKFVQAWIERFLDVQGIDRAMALAAQAFSALIPLLIVSSAVVSHGSGSKFADNLIDRFNLTGAAADSVRQAFTASSTVEDSISVIGLLLLLVSALSFSRGMQRLYEGAYKLPALGMRNTKWGLAWLALLALYATVRPIAAGVSDNEAIAILISIVGAAVAWTISPDLLLGRRANWRRLLPGGLLTAFGMTALGVSSIIWFPRTVQSSAEQFGVMGVAFAMLSWLVAAAFVLVVAATGGAVIADYADAGRERDGAAAS